MGQSDPATFGQLLRQLRFDAGLTQEALAERAGLSVRGVQGLERGLRHPYRETVDLLVKALKLDGEARARFIAAGRPSPRPIPISAPGAPASSGTTPVGAAGSSQAGGDDQPGAAFPQQPVRSNLPVQLTSFVGRQGEMAEVERLLRTTRLLTLTGAGGCGKTRLAYQVAADVLDEYPDGVWTAELATITDPGLVPQTVASALGAREETGQPTVAALVAHLRNRRPLLILDNCEHLIDASARLADEVLRSCPRVQVLATSREALGVAGELPWRVPSLSFPDPRETPTAESLGQYEAVRLFAERAATVQPGFGLTVQNAAAVCDICSRLDGIPLALELAAARLRVLTAEQVAKRLDDQFRLLAGRSRTALPRHQTLRATIDWSYDLLSSDEKVLLRRLSAFVGGWTLEAAEAIAGDGDQVPGVGGPGPGDEGSEGAARATGGRTLGPACDAANPPSRRAPDLRRPTPNPQRLAPADILDLMTELVDKSLVQVETKGDEARYRLLETVRQYAQDRLGESGEASRVRDRHRDWHAGQVRRAMAEMDRNEGLGPWPGWFAAEQGNLRSALEWSIEGDPEVALLLAIAVTREEPNSAWLEGLLPKAPARTELRAQAVFFLAQAYQGRADYAAAWRWYDEALTLSREAPWPFGVAWTIECLGLLAHEAGDDRRALQLYEESLAAYRQVGSNVKPGWVLLWLSMTHSRNGDFARARAVLEESLAIFRRTDETSIPFALHGLGVVALAEGDLAQAQQLFEQGDEVLRQPGDGYPAFHTTLAAVARREGDHARAQALLEEALIVFRRIGSDWALRVALTQLAALARQEGQLGRADALLVEAQGVQRGRPMDRLGHASVLAGQALLAQARGDRRQVEELYRRVLAVARESTNRQERAICLYLVAAVAAAVGAADRCARLAGSASTVLSEVGLTAVLTTWLRGYPDIYCEAAEALDTTRAALGSEAFARLWAEGRAMALDQAVEYALSDDADA